MQTNLIGAALVSGFLQEWIDALAIIAIVIVNAILEFIQEYRADMTKRIAAPDGGRNIYFIL